MALDNVQEIKVQDNEQAPWDALRAHRCVGMGISTELRQWAAKAELLANVDFELLTDQGADGIVYLLRELSDGIFDLSEKLGDLSRKAD